MKMQDYITSEQRIAAATSLDAKRRASIEHLRSIGRLIIDPGCTWRPRSAAHTDVRITWAEAREREKKAPTEAGANDH
jgi:hypothetical protein